MRAVFGPYEGGRWRGRAQQLRRRPPSRDEWLWGLSLVWSRSFGLPSAGGRIGLDSKAPALAPLVGMLNGAAYHARGLVASGMLPAAVAQQFKGPAHAHLDDAAASHARLPPATLARLRARASTATRPRRSTATDAFFVSAGAPSSAATSCCCFTAAARARTSSRWTTASRMRGGRIAPLQG